MDWPLSTGWWRDAVTPARRDRGGRGRRRRTGGGGFRRVLEAFEAETGVPVVMNTSFNGPGEPIVETPDQALAFLETSEIDAVYVDGRKFTRRRPD